MTAGERSAVSRALSAGTLLCCGSISRRQRHGLHSRDDGNLESAGRCPAGRGKRVAERSETLSG